MTNEEKINEYSLFFTFALVFQFARVSRVAPGFLFLLLTLTALVEVLDDDADEHVEHEEADEKEERDEVDQAPFIVIRLRLNEVMRKRN